MEPNPFNDVKEIRPATDGAAAPESSRKLVQEKGPEQPVLQRRWLVGLVVVVLIFLTGFVPMWLKAGRLASERDAARSEVKLLQLESVAAAAAVDARRGEYESARQSASWFFTALRAELDVGPRSSLSQAQQNSLKPLLAHRDSLITLLARSDPAAAERLTEVYLKCRQSLRGGRME